MVGSNTVLESAGKKVRGRVYPWGVVEGGSHTRTYTHAHAHTLTHALCSVLPCAVDNIEHCDFTTLRSMLIRTHMQDLKDVTQTMHYENYRLQKLAGVVGPSDNKVMAPPDR